MSTSSPRGGGPLVVRGARQHNLRGVDLTLPTDALVAVAGVSGSGKSSFAFDTVHAEGQRRYLEALSLQGRSDLVGRMPRPDVDVVHGLPPTVALPQDAVTPSKRTRVAALVDAWTPIRVLWGRAGTLRDPATGAVVEVTRHDAIVDALEDLPEGSRLHVEAPVAVRDDPDGVLREIVRSGFSRVRVGGEVRRVEDVRPADVADGFTVVVDRIKVAPGKRARLDDAVRTASRAGRGRVVAVWDGGTATFADRPLVPGSLDPLPSLRPALFLAPGPDACAACEGVGQVDDAACGACAGTGMGPVARAVTLGGLTVPEVLAMPVGELVDRLGALPDGPVTAPLLAELRERLGALATVGLEHLRLGRHAATLSRGELQRVRLARQVGADLSGVLYVLDEPTTGLDAAHVARLIALFRGLVSRGNGVLVVEHHPDVLRAADHVVEFGPGPGVLGGQVLHDGSPDALIGRDTPTGRWLASAAALPREPSRGDGEIRLDGAAGRNLHGDPVSLVRGGFTVISGPSGAGKTALLDALHGHLKAHVDEAPGPPGTLEGADGIVRIIRVDDQAARRSRRSMPATYVGFWDTMRSLLAATREAQVRGFEASTFSLNVAGGRCEGCGGLGVQRISLHVVPDVDVPCDVCEGRRFTRDVLEVRWKGRHAGDLLGMSADEALPVLAGHPGLEEGLRALRDVDLGYVPLGQPAHTLSGGEARRLRLARELVRSVRRGAADTVFLLDDPTQGLHPEDVAGQAALLRRLVADGATVVVATHDRRLAATADRVVELGPGVAEEGGHVVAQGPPDDVSPPDGPRRA